MHSSLFLPPLDSLAAVIASARLGSFSLAARELGITHGSVSRRVHAVESWLGTPIFLRHGRGVRLTSAGEHFSRQVESALSKISEVAADLRAVRATPSRLRLSVLPSVARLWLMPHLAQLQQAFPGLMLHIVPEHRVASLDDTDADLAIRYGHGRWPGVDAELLMRERMFAVCAPPLAKALRDRTPASTMRETLLHDSDSQHWRAWSERRGVVYKPRGGERRFDDYDLVLGAAEAGLGVAIARWPLAAAAVNSGRLVRIDEFEFPGKKAHYAVMRSGDSRLPVKRLVTELKNLAARSV